MQAEVAEAGKAMVAEGAEEAEEAEASGREFEKVKAVKTMGVGVNALSASTCWTMIRVLLLSGPQPHLLSRCKSPTA